MPGTYASASNISLAYTTPPQRNETQLTDSEKQRVREAAPGGGRCLLENCPEVRPVCTLLPARYHKE